MWEQKDLVKVLQHLYIYTEFCLLCQVSLTLGIPNSLTLSHWGVAKASPTPEIFTRIPS